MSIWMSDTEMVYLCAVAMNWHERVRRTGMKVDPLYNDKQAMALVKEFGLCIAKAPNAPWAVVFGSRPSCYNDDLNRAIVECVADMQLQRRKHDVPV